MNAANVSRNLMSGSDLQYLMVSDNLTSFVLVYLIFTFGVGGHSSPLWKFNCHHSLRALTTIQRLILC